MIERPLSIDISLDLGSGEAWSFDRRNPKVKTSLYTALERFFYHHPSTCTKVFVEVIQNSISGKNNLNAGCFYFNDL